MGPPQPLGSLPLGNVQVADPRALMEQAREERFPVWLTAAQKQAFPRRLCWRDQFPEIGEVDLTNYLPSWRLRSGSRAKQEPGPAGADLDVREVGEQLPRDLRGCSRRSGSC